MVSSTRYLDADPHVLWSEVRAAQPVLWEERLGCWLLTGYHDNSRVLREHQRFSNEVHTHWDDPRARYEGHDCALTRLRNDWMLVADPPKHTRLRNLVRRAFSVRTIEQLAPRIQSIVDQLIERVLERGELELVRDLARPLPVQVICELLGLPQDHQPRIASWIDDAALMADAVTSSAFRRADEVAAAATEYFEQLVAERSAGEPRDDLLGALCAARENDDRLSPAEVVANAVLLFAAGHETTVNLIANATLALLRDEGQRRLLQRGEVASDAAVDELMRYESPVKATGRVALADCEIGGQHIRRGQLLHCMLIAANRDPAQFEDPDRLDLARPNARTHLGFGHGIHFCLGAALGKLEARIAIASLFERLPALRLVEGEPRWQRSFVFRRLAALPLRFD